MGSGLAGLVAAAELADAGKRVIVRRPGARAEPGRPGILVARRVVPGRYSRTAPAGRERLVMSSPSATGWAPPASTATKTTGRGSGPRRMSRLPPARRGRGFISRGCAGFRSWDGPSAAGMGRLDTAIPCRDFTSPGAPGRACSSRSCGGRGRPRQKGLITFKFRHRVDELLLTNGAVDGVRGAILEPSDVPRGVKSSRTVVGEFTLAGRRGHRRLRRDRRQPRAGAATLAQTAGRARPTFMVQGVPDHVDGRMLAITEAAGARLINRDRMWHYTEGIRNWNPIWPNHGIRISARADRHCGWTRPASGCRRRFIPVSTTWALSNSSRSRAMSTPGLCSTRRSSSVSSRCRAPSKTRT